MKEQATSPRPSPPSDGGEGVPRERLTIHCGDALAVLRKMAGGSVQCCVTSPPYWGLRDYGVAGQLGLESTPEEYVAKLVEVFREVRRVLREDGTLWLNLGDSYSGGGKGGNPGHAKHVKQATNEGSLSVRNQKRNPLPAKQLIGIPWRVAFALQSDGWWLRQWVPWIKRNGMTESVRDRPACACELIFLLSKSKRYHYDGEAVKLPASQAFLNDKRHQTGSNDLNIKEGYEAARAQNPKRLHRMFDKQRGHSRKHAGFNERWDKMEKAEQCGGWRTTRNSDWFFEGMMTDDEGMPLAFVVAPAQSRENHFATFPRGLVLPMIRASCPAGGVVLDPFGGSGTTGMVALEEGRRAVLIELNAGYVELMRRRCDVTPGLGIG